jgi:hypothetical protein
MSGHVRSLLHFLVLSCLIAARDGLSTPTPITPITPITPPQAAKEGFHPRNLHRFGYDFETYFEASPELKPYVQANKYGTLTIGA